MMTMDLQTLNDRFAIEGHVTFVEGEGGQLAADIRNERATARVYLQGAHVATYQPAGHDPVLWVSSECLYQSGKAIRGGIPVCWPWFADHPTDSSLPAHGFVRASGAWSVEATEALPGGGTRIVFSVRDDETTRGHWPHAFHLRLVVDVGEELSVVATAENTGDAPWTRGGALHSYFTVGDATTIAVEGLSGKSYVDKVDGFKTKTQDGPVRIAAETDWIYLDTTDEVTIVDPAMKRKITVGKSGSHTTVVWNPWAENAAAMKDFGNDDYQGMVCVEAANAAEDTATVAPGGSHTLGTVIRVEKEG